MFSLEGCFFQVEAARDLLEQVEAARDLLQYDLLELE